MEGGEREGVAMRKRGNVTRGRMEMWRHRIERDLVVWPWIKERESTVTGRGL